MKKFLSVLIAVAILIASVTAITVYAQTDENETELPVGVYPESEHDYPNDFNHTWTYTHPTEAEGLFITFSEESSLDEEEHKVTDEDDYWITYDKMEVVSHSDRVNRYYFYNDEFSGRTFYLDGNSFSISLSTDSEGTDYGFSIDRISHLPPENETMIRYHYYDSEKVDEYELFGNDEAKIIMSSSPRKSGYAFSGWSTEYGGKAEYFYCDTLEKRKSS